MDKFWKLFENGTPGFSGEFETKWLPEKSQKLGFFFGSAGPVRVKFSQLAIFDYLRTNIKKDTTNVKA